MSPKLQNRAPRSRPGGTSLTTRLIGLCLAMFAFTGAVGVTLVGYATQNGSSALSVSPLPLPAPLPAAGGDPGAGGGLVLPGSVGEAIARALGVRDGHGNPTAPDHLDPGAGSPQLTAFDLEDGTEFAETGSSADGSGIESSRHSEAVATTPAVPPASAPPSPSTEPVTAPVSGSSANSGLFVRTSVVTAPPPPEAPEAPAEPEVSVTPPAEPEPPVESEPPAEPEPPLEPEPPVDPVAPAEPVDPPVDPVVPAEPPVAPVEPSSEPVPPVQPGAPAAP